MTIKVSHENVKHFVFGKIVWAAVHHRASEVFEQKLVKREFLKFDIVRIIRILFTIIYLFAFNDVLMLI